MITMHALTKDFGRVRAVDGLTTSIAPGEVTAFLGPNGAGKTTALRMLAGLSRPTSGSATVLGTSYRSRRRALARIGVMLDPLACYPGRSARNHLRSSALANGLRVQRVGEVLDQVELAGQERRRISTYSLGMRQRLGLAAALLGDPEVLILDEPLNGLDAAGIRWLRGFLRQQADEGCTVLIASHLMRETQAVTDRVVMINHGRIVTDLTCHDIGGQYLEDLYFHYTEGELQ